MASSIDKGQRSNGLAQAGHMGTRMRTFFASLPQGDLPLKCTSSREQQLVFLRQKHLCRAQNTTSFLRGLRRALSSEPRESP